MEDPVRFAVWCVVRPGGAQAAAEALVVRQPGTTVLEAKKRANRALVEGAGLLLAPAAGWQEATRLRAEPPAWASSVALFQEGYGPAPSGSYCEVHDLNHGGCLGCHVCNGFYVP